MNRVPDALADLGRVFAPVQPRAKRCYASRDADDLLAVGDDALDIFLHSGFNYAVVMRGDLAALDADDTDVLGDALAALPRTAWQITGSRSGRTYFLRVPGLDADIDLSHPDTGENVGHVKAAPKSYVVGPGSRHPSGNRYGPLRDADAGLATVDRDTLADLLAPFTSDRGDARLRDTEPPPSDTPRDTHGDGVPASATGRGDGQRFDLSVHDVLGSTPEDERFAHPVHGSTTGANFLVNEDGRAWRCWRHGATGNALHLIGLQHGIIECGEWTDDGLDAATWGDIFEAARANGHDVPPPRSDVEPVAMLPPAARNLHHAGAGGEWGGLRVDDRYQDADGDPGPLSLAGVRQRIQSALADALRRGTRVLIDAPPGAGKSHGAIMAAAETDTPITVLVPRGNREQYEELSERAATEDLTTHTLPSAHRDCPTFLGEHGEEWRHRARDLHARGVPPATLHERAEQWLGRPLPCNADAGCPYSAKWLVDPDEFDVLLGHYGHAHVPSVTRGRSVVIDEFPGAAFATTFSADPATEGPAVDPVVNAYVRAEPALPFVDVADLDDALTAASASDPERASDIADALEWFAMNGVHDDPGHAVCAGETGHALAPHVTYATLAARAPRDVLAALDLHRTECGDGWLRVTLPDRAGTAVLGTTNTGHRAIHIHRPPDLTLTRGVLALDGTPTHDMWRNALGTHLRHHQVLSDDERTVFVRDTLGLRVIQTTTDAVPVSSGKHVSPRQTAALLDAIREEHGRVPDGLITSRRARDALLDADTFPKDLLPDYLRERDPGGGGRWYGDLLGSNRHKHARLGVVLGSRHFGDAYVKYWTTLAGHPFETPDRGDPANRGMALDYGEYGNQVLEHMADNQAAQAILRFGRDGGGATVYVHTARIPDWVPIAGEGRVVRTRSDGERAVLHAAIDLGRTQGSFTTADIVDHPAVTLSRQQVFAHLDRLHDARDACLVRRVEGRGYVWRPDGLDHVTKLGEVELPRLDPATDITATEVRQAARNSSLTEHLTNFARGELVGVETSVLVAPTNVGVGAGASGRDRPPD